MYNVRSEWVQKSTLKFCLGRFRSHIPTKERNLVFGMKNNGSKNVASVVKELISPVAEEMSYFLWDVEFVKEGADKYLRITIDCRETQVPQAPC